MSTAHSDNPRFIRNEAGFQALNLFHVLVPKEPLNEAQLKALLAYRNSSAGVRALHAVGRVCGSGLRKAEPRELGRMQVLDVCSLNEGDVATLAGAFDAAVANVRRHGLRNYRELYLDPLVEAVLG